MAAAITKPRGGAVDIPAPRRVSITWSSPFCVGADDADEPTLKVAPAKR